MSATQLHYIFDPLCGWCYGAAPLAAAARDLLTVVPHGGGMMTGPNRQQVSENLRNYVMPHDRRISQMSGQPFGEAYFDGLLRDTGAVFDSAPPITAILAAQKLENRGLDMLARIQRAHYVEGRRVADEQVLQSLAVELGLGAALFDAAYAELVGTPTNEHIAQSRKLLSRVGGQGFPTFVIERQGQFQVLDVGAYLGDVAGWRAELVRQTQA
jgi:putative protein-disulfide isomerase